MFYIQLKERFQKLAGDHDLLDEQVAISARILSNAEAIGNPTRQDYPLLKGKEFLMEARFRASQGQAFTDAPCETATTLGEILDLPLDSVGNRALFIAALNAVMRHLRPELGTVHCHDDQPEECACELVHRLQEQKIARIGLVGLQPALLESLAGAFGAWNVSCVDRDNSQRGKSKFGVPIRWGDDKETRELFITSDIVFATGSTVVNGSLPGLMQLAERYETPLVFYGTSIAGAAELMGLKRFCHKAA